MLKHNSPNKVSKLNMKNMFCFSNESTVFVSNGSHIPYNMPYFIALGVKMPESMRKPDRVNNLHSFNLLGIALKV